MSVSEMPAGQPDMEQVDLDAESSAAPWAVRAIVLGIAGMLLSVAGLLAGPDSILMVLTQVAGVVQLVAAAGFLIWFYRAARIAYLRGYPQRRSPAWAVVGFLLPAISLWFPYQHARDMYP